MSDLPKHLRAFDDTKTARQWLMEDSLSALQKRFPIEDDEYRLELNNPRFDGKTNYGLARQKQALLKDEQLRLPIKGQWRLIHKPTSQVLDEREDTVMHLPYLTNRGTFLYGGNEYSTVNQSRLKSGVYTRRKKSGEIEAFYNIKPGTGRTFRVWLEPETGVFKVNMGQSNIPLVPLLRAMGVSDKEMNKTWGPEITAVNLQARAAQATEKFYERLSGKPATEEISEAARNKAILDTLAKAEVDPDVVARTLGLQGAKNISPALLLRSTQKLLNVSRNEEDPDDRDAPMFSRVLSMEDFIRERIENDAGRTARTMLWKARRDKSLKRVGPAALNPYVHGYMFGSRLTMPLEETNPLSLLEQAGRISKLGEGGIGDAESITDEARNVNIGQLGFVDPILGPEGLNIGIDVRAAYNTFKGRDGQMYAEFKDPKTGELKYLRPEDLAGKTIAFPGELERKKPTVMAVVNGKIEEVSKDAVDVAIPSFAHMMSANTNLNPMPTGVQPARQFYGAKFWGQYMPQAKGEVPLVDSTMDGGQTFSEFYGKRIGAITADKPGRVSKVTKDAVHVVYDDGEQDEIELVQDFPFNRITGISYGTTLQPGTSFDKGAMLAHSNFVDPKTGSLAMGRNLRTAVLPYKGKSVSGDTNVFWRRPDGTSTYGNIKDAVTGPGMQSLALDHNTWRSTLLPVHAYMLHAPDSPLHIVETVDGMQVKATASHSFVGYFGDDLRECTSEELLTSGALVPVVQPIIPFDTGDRTIECRSAAGKAAAYEFVLDRDFGWVVGMYLAEGCAAYRGDTAHHVSWAVTELELISRLEVFFARQGIHTRTDVRRTADGLTGSVAVYSAAIAQWFAANCGRYAWFKRLPDCVWTAPPAFAEGLIDGYFCGDGTVTNKQCTATTTSKLLADGMTFLLGALGVRATHREYSNGKLAKRVAYQIHVFREFLTAFPALSLARKQRALCALMGAKVKFSRDRIPIPESELPVIRKLFKRRLPKDKYVSRQLLRGYYAGLPPKIRALVDAPVWWDIVKRIIPCATEEYVYDLDMRPLGNFAVNGGWIVHNSYEDAYVISEEAARKLATRRLYGFDQDNTHGVEINAKKYMALFPDKFKKPQLGNIDAQGIVKAGTTLNYGDPIILATGPKLLTPEDVQLGKLHKALRNAQTDKSVVWEHEYPGIVTDAVMTRHGAKVNVRAEVPVQVGDKLSTRFGLKGVVGTIVPMDKMPRDAASNEPYDLLLNPMGILSRVAPNQLVELQLGKVARRTGKQMRIPQLPPDEGWTAWALKQLEDAGIPEKEAVFDPESEHTLPPVATGETYVMPFHHLSEKKLSERGSTGVGYTMDELPAKGGDETQQAKKMSGMDITQLLAHGATEVIKDAQVVRGARNEDFWKALKLGRPLPEPKVPFVYNKFLNLMKAGGINVVQRGNNLDLLPMTDDDITQLSKGAITSSKMLDDNLEPLPGGLFDPGRTGGALGKNWSHVELNEPIPNPVFEEPIRRILGLKKQQLRNVLTGQEELNGSTGGEAIRKALAAVDIDAEIEKQQKNVTQYKGSNRDNSVKILSYLHAAKKQGIHPSNWMMTKVPVIPPVFRPVSKLGDITIEADLNELYRDMIEVNNAIGELRKDVSDKSLREEKETLYDAVSAVMGLGDPITPEGQSRRLKGAIRSIIGDNPKSGFFQSRVMSKPVDVVGRGVVTPDPNLDMDSIGIPEDSAWRLYKDFVLRKLVQQNIPVHKALEMIEERNEQAKQALENEMQRRPVLVDRAPTWHKFNILAFTPHLVEGNTVHVSPLITKGFTMDFDGDAVNFHVPVTDKAVDQAREKMMPSKNLFSLTDLKSVRHSPQQEMALGLYMLTRKQTKKPPVKFATIAEAKLAYKRGEIGANDPIIVG